MKLKQKKGFEKEYPVWIIALGILLATVLLVWLVVKTMNGESLWTILE